jgi:DHA2 family multidrug resistance protein
VADSSAVPVPIPAEKYTRRQRGLITAAVMLATLMQAIDTTIANVALPHMQGTMGVFHDQISWVLTSYVLAVAIFIPLTGFLTARLGRKRLFIISIIGFTLASMLCGAAQDIYQIVIFRFMQGVFGAPLVPLSQTVMLDTYPREKHGSAMALWGMGIMVGPIIGPTLGGWLTEYYSWRWVFYINLPIGLLTAVGVSLFLPETARDSKRKFDLLGFVFLSLSIGALQMMLDRGESLGWFESPEIIVEAVLAALFFYLFLAHVLTCKQPFIDLRMFANSNFASGMTLMFFMGTILLAVLALLPPFMEGLMGYPIIDVGILIAPRGAGTVVGMLLMGRLVNRADARIYVVIGLILVATSLWQMSRFTIDVGAMPMIISGVIQGLGLGFVLVPLTTLTFATLAPHYRIEATPLYNLVRNLGGSIGVSVVITELSQNTQANHAALANYITPYGHALRQAVESGMISTQSSEGLMALNTKVTEQALLLAYLQDFRLLMWASIFAIPLVFLFKKPASDKPSS